MRLLTSTETHIMLVDIAWLLKITLICKQNIQNVIWISSFYAEIKEF